MRRPRHYTRKITVALTEDQRQSLEEIARILSCDISDVVREEIDLAQRRGNRLSRFEQCNCGAYRLQILTDTGWGWGAGCRACDEIFRLRQLPGAGVSISEGETAETLRGKLRIAEEEIERLRSDYRATLEDVGVDKEDQDKRLFLAHCTFPGQEP